MVNATRGHHIFRFYCPRFCDDDSKADGKNSKMMASPLKTYADYVVAFDLCHSCSYLGLGANSHVIGTFAP